MWIYLVGHAVSTTGFWTHTTAFAWLVLTLSGDGRAIGAAIALQFLPALLLGPAAGLLADRLPKRRVLMAAQVAGAVCTGSLGWATATGNASLPLAFCLAFVFGCVTAVENPARMSLVPELADEEKLPRSYSLNALAFNSARVIGPALAGALIAASGETTGCFAVAAGTRLFMAVALRAITLVEVSSGRADSQPGEIRAGVRYAWRTPAIRWPLVSMAVISVLAYQHQVLLPLLAQRTFDGDAATLGMMTAAMGLGAIAGGLVGTRVLRTGRRAIAVRAVFMGLALALCAAAPTLPLAVAALAVLGAMTTVLATTAMSTIQAASEPGMRGRVAALWFVVMLGSAPIGGPIMGVLAELADPRWGFGLGAAAVLLVGVVGIATSRPGGNGRRNEK
ncbi:MFS transporter [Acrocarpospora macrocephala]|uniref:MFS transporter n=1 Tax=Acrocarpospora macrocephala TaxID=150177 RepID=A0A5M3WSC0_9ACTN|nr:MFS transporter [Acrocarpospora macrocephala]